MPSPLDNLQQQVYDSRDGVQTRYFVSSRIRKGEWEVTMWAQAEEGKAPKVWAGLGDDVRGEEVADAIEQGMLSVQDRNGGGKKLVVHTTKTPVSVYLDPAEGEDTVGILLEAAFSLVSKPAQSSGGSETRVLAAQLEEKEAEISSLTAKLVSLKGTIQRQTGSSGRQDVVPTSPARKPPAPKNASKLQPNQKRRKIVEDEFAGSSADEDSDEEEEEEEDSEEEYEDE